MKWTRVGMAIAVIMGSFPAVDVIAAPAFHGSLSQRYKLRATGSIHDQDAESILSLEMGNPSTDRFSGAIQGGGILDLDGRETTTPFRSVYDTFDRPLVGRLYYAYLDGHDLGAIERLRAGRQHRYEFESLYYDGLHLEAEQWYGLTLSAFGGVPVHQFENEIGFDPGDWLAGSSLEWQPVDRFKARFDYAHVKDKITGFRVTAGDQEDDLFGGLVVWDVDDHVNLESRFTSFSDQVRDVSLATRLAFSEQNFSLRLRGYRLLKGYDVRVIEWDAFGIAGTYLPYTELMLTVTKGIGEHWSIDGGASVRRLDREQVASAFNHGFDRFFLSASTMDLPLDGMSLSATADYYRGTDNSLKDNTFGGSFSVDQELLERRLKLSGGTAYALYRYNVLAGDESVDVQTYFGRVRWKIIKPLEARLGYEFEHNSVRDIHALDGRLVWSF